MSRFFLSLLFRLVSILPFWILYRISDFIYFLLEYVLAYRKKVIHKNLNIVFPGKSEKEKALIRKNYYRYLADLFIEIPKLYGISEENLKERVVLKNPALLENYYGLRMSVIMAMVHIGNHEWASCAASLQVRHTILGVFLPLKNKAADSVFLKMRGRFKMIPVAREKVMRTLLKFREPFCLGLISDQSPLYWQAHWLNFFGRATPVHYGMEKLGKKLNVPVLFTDIKRVGRGNYELEFSVLAEKPDELQDGELLKKYFAKLEQCIIEQPECWLWSHNRWKWEKYAPENLEN